MKRIILTGGGTAGHVTPNMALVPTLKERGYDIQYIGSYDGMEKKLIEDMGIPYHGIATGKLRRYFDLRNFSDPFRVIKGFNEAKKLMKELKPDVVFSKGGFVSVPVVLAASAKKIPCIIHESDMTPGLANKISIPKASKVCCNFAETMENLPAGKAVVTGTPIRQELFAGDAVKAMTFCGFTEVRPTLLVIGGSSGSVRVNEAIRSCLPELTKKYNLYFASGKERVKQHRLKEPDKTKYELYSILKMEVARCGNWNILIANLKKQGVDVRFKYKGSSDEVQCVIFSKNGYPFSGSKIDRRFSYSKIAAALNANRYEERLWEMGNQAAGYEYPMQQPPLFEPRGSNDLYSGSIGLFIPANANTQADENYFKEQLKRKNKKKKQRKIRF